MAISCQDLDALTTLFLEAEDATRTTNPSFLGGFHTISMQAARLQDAADRLILVEQRLESKKTKITAQLQLWRRRYSLQDSHSRKVLPSFHDPSARNRKLRNPKTTVKSPIFSPSAKRLKIDFEQHDWELRNQMAGIDALSTIVTDCKTVLSLRIRACSTLEKIGTKLSDGIFDIWDGEKLGVAYEEIVDGSIELDEINGMIDLLEENF